MDYGGYQYDEPYARPRRRINYFAWTVAILLLTGFAFAAWLGSFYIFDQPERPDSYRILQRLHKIDPPKRFELTAAPPGEFLNAKQMFDRYVAMGAAELAKTNTELLRNYIKNYQHVPGLVPYVTGRYLMVDARELGPNDVFTSGMIALTNSVDHAELLMEHVYPASPMMLPLMKQTLNMGLEIKLERTHDISAVIHAERLPDGRIMITAVPLLYGNYTVTKGPGTFRLEPPLSLNLAAGWPLFKDETRTRAELHYANYRRQQTGPQGAVPIGLPAAGTPPPAENQLVRIEPAKPVVSPPPATAQTNKFAKLTPTPKGGKFAKKQKGAPSPAASETAVPPPRAIAVATPAAAVTPTPMALAALSPSPKPIPTALPLSSPPPQIAAASPTPAPTAQPAVPAQSPPTDTSGIALASTAGGGNWKTYPAGKMPIGRLIGTGDLRDMADRGLAGERIYLRGQFVVNFADANRAVLRPRTKLTDKVLHFGAGSNTRIIVEFPAGRTPPAQGSVISRDEARPYEITEIRKQEDGQLNIFAREIME
ncbi:MAG: hypothetical protein ABR514_01805 [Chthoniobacterales bacterium]